MVYRLFVVQKDDDRITVFRISPVSGRLAVEQEYALPGGPAPLAFDPLLRWIVVGTRAEPGLVVVPLGPNGLEPALSTVALPDDACYVSLDRTGRYILTAYYAAGRCGVHRIASDGSIDPQAVQWIDTEPHAHCIRTDRSNRYAYLPQTMPANHIRQYAFDSESGRLSPLAEPFAPVEPGAGPRHYTYHPVLDRVYVSNENGSSVSAYALDAPTGHLSRLETWSTLPEGYGGNNSCAQIHLDPDGRWLFVSNRGHNSLAVFAVDAQTGMLMPAGHRITEPTPRAFGMDPTGQYVYAAGLGSNRLAAYRLDHATGQLEPIDTYDVGRNPMWVQSVNLPAAT